MNTITFPSKRQNVWDINHALFVAGRMLALCQKFELTCKHSLSMVLFLKSLDEGRTLEEGWQKYDKSMKCFLGKICDNVKAIERIPKEAMDEIGKARDARNEICHELLVDTIVVSSDSWFKDFEKKGNYESRGAVLAHYIDLGCPAFPQKKTLLR